MIWLRRNTTALTRMTQCCSRKLAHTVQATATPRSQMHYPAFAPWFSPVVLYQMGLCVAPHQGVKSLCVHSKTEGKSRDSLKSITLMRGPAARHIRATDVLIPARCHSSGSNLDFDLVHFQRRGRQDSSYVLTSCSADISPLPSSINLSLIRACSARLSSALRTD